MVHVETKKTNGNRYVDVVPPLYLGIGQDMAVRAQTAARMHLLSELQF